MEKKHHFQGFRKFSIKTRLVIALLLISIIPLAGISGYSFHIFSVALREKLSASISQTLSMINLNMVSEIEKYQYLCGSICISEEIKDGLLNKDMSDIEKNQAINEIQHMVRTKIIYPAQAKNITVYDTDGQRGIFVPGSDDRNAAKEALADVGNNMGNSVSITHSAGQQVAMDLSRGLIQSGTQLLSKKIRTVRITLKAGYKVLLVPKRS